MFGNRKAHAVRVAGVALALSIPAPAAAQNPLEQVDTLMTASGPLAVRNVTGGLEHP